MISANSSKRPAVCLASSAVIHRLNLIQYWRLLRHLACVDPHANSMGRAYCLAGIGFVRVGTLPGSAWWWRRVRITGDTAAVLVLSAHCDEMKESTAC